MSACCAAVACYQLKPKGKVMCRRHWHVVPVELQKRVSAAANEGKAGELKTALREAVRAVAEKEGRRT